MGRMHGAPVGADVETIQKKSDGASAERSDCAFHFRHLLGDMDVQRAAAGEISEFADLLGSRGAQRMWREAEIGAIQRADDLLAAREQALKTVEIVDEAALLSAWRRAAEARMGVEHRQQCEPDARAFRGLGDPRAELADVVIGAAVGGVVQVMKLANWVNPASSIST